MSVPNCEGCKIEYEEMIKYIKNFNLNFVGSGLFEKGHLKMILVNDSGKMEVG